MNGKMIWLKQRKTAPALDIPQFQRVSISVVQDRQRTLKPQRFQGSFYAIWAGVFPLFFPLQIFKGNFQGV